MQLAGRLSHGPGAAYNLVQLSGVDLRRRVSWLSFGWHRIAPHKTRASRELSKIRKGQLCLVRSSV
jgi:hypothetical protein